MAMTGIACLATMLLLGFLAMQLASLLALPAALLAASAAYFALGNAAALHVFAPHTAPNAPAEPGTFAALCRQIVRPTNVLLRAAAALSQEPCSPAVSLDAFGYRAPLPSTLVLTIGAGGSAGQIEETRTEPCRPLFICPDDLPALSAGHRGASLSP